jgi:hypothetical protein
LWVATSQGKIFLLPYIFGNFRAGFGGIVLSSILVFLCCTAGLLHSLPSYGFSHQPISQAFFFLNTRGKGHATSIGFFLERVVVVAVKVVGRL